MLNLWMLVSGMDPQLHNAIRATETWVFFIFLHSGIIFLDIFADLLK